MTVFSDSYGEFIVTDSGHLPHIHIPGAVQFVTFRLADSMPQSVIREIKEQSKIFIEKHPKPWTIATIEQYREIISDKTEQLVDNGYGACYMRREEVRKIISDALHFFDTRRYNLYDYVIMPNHVHVLIQVLDGYSLPWVMHSIKSFTAHAINKHVGRTGTLWLRESYDRIIRNEDDYARVTKYIHRNPQYLPPTDYTLYSAPTTPY